MSGLRHYAKDAGYTRATAGYTHATYGQKRGCVDGRSETYEYTPYLGTVSIACIIAERAP